MADLGPPRPPLPATGEGPLLERQREVTLLDALIEEARGGAGRVALIEGEAGIGKSRLLGEARARATAQHFRVLAARASELEREFAFAVVRRLFEPIVTGPLGSPWLAGSAGPAAAVFEPLGTSSDANAGTNWFATLDGLYRLAVDAAAEAPLLLEIDDIQWCDRPSLRFLAYLVHRLDGLPALVAVGLRAAEPGSDAMLLGEIVHDAATASIYPAPLSEVASAALFRTRLGAEPDSRFVAASHRATGGNPLLLEELLRVMDAEKVPPDAAHVDAIRDIGPRAVSRTVLLRLSRLPVEAVAVARATAVLGEDASLPAISGLAELSEARVAEAGRALVRAEILRPEPPHGYLHPLVRDAVYHELAPVERELRHAQAARLLLGMGVEVEQVAAHLLRAPCRGESWVVAVLRDASLRAMQKGAAESAVSYLRRALAESPPAAERPQLLLALGMAEALVHAPSSAEHLKAALDTLPDPASRARAAQVLARMLIFTRPPEEAVAVVKQAAAELPAELLDQRRALEAMELYAVDFGAPEERTASRLARVRDGIEGDGPGTRMLKAVAAWDWALTGGPAPACVELALTALADGVLVAADPAFMSIVAIGVLVLADRDEADVAWESALAEAHRRGSLDALAGVHIWRGWTWLQRGELGEAERSLRQAIEETTLWNSQQGAAMPYAQGLLARVLVERGELAGARDALARRGSPIPTSDGDGLCRRGEVELLLVEGRPHEAAEAADEYAARLRRVVNPGWAPWRSFKAQALDRLGRRDEALALLAEELAFARSWGAPGTVAQTLRILGTMEGGDGLDHLREAVEVAAGSPARLEHGKALAALGTSLRHARRPTDAREPLRGALELATRCGAAPLADRARAELLAAGGRVRSRTLVGPGSLTPGERRVVDLAVEGRSNREIAQTLYITPKTVEVHLSSAYQKLGIRSRQQLGTALVDPA